MIKKTFTVMKHKVTIKETEKGWEAEIACPSADKMFKYKVVCADISDVRSELHELANNNDVGNAISRKIYDWYYTEIEPRVDMVM